MDYASLYNLGKKNRENEISQIIRNELSNIKTEYSDYRGLCKFIANNIQVELNNNSIRNYKIDLNEYGIDHVVLIAEYEYKKDVDSIIRERVLIDPTYGQFVKQNENEVSRLGYYPDENISNYISNDLTTKGYILIDDSIYSEYLSGFLNRKVNINLDEYLNHYIMEQQEKGRN